MGKYGLPVALVATAGLVVSVALSGGTIVGSAAPGITRSAAHSTVPSPTPSIEHCTSGDAALTALVTRGLPATITAQRQQVETRLGSVAYDGRRAFYALSMSISADDLEQLKNVVLTFDLDGGKAFVATLLARYFRPGASRYPVPHSSFTPRRGAIESDWASVSAVRIAVEPKSDATRAVSVVLTELAYAYPSGSGAITFSFDDAWMSAFDIALPAMQAHGMRGVVFAATASQIGKPRKMGVAELAVLQQNGWDIASHTVSHVALTDRPAFLDAELHDSQQFLLNAGLRSGARFVASPSGIYDDHVLERIEAYYDVHRTTRFGLETLPTVDRFELRSWGTLAAFPLELVEAWVDTAAANGEWLILNIHNLVEDGATDVDWPISRFRSLVDYVATRNVRVLTFTDVFCGSH